MSIYILNNLIKIRYYLFKNCDFFFIIVHFRISEFLLPIHSQLTPLVHFRHYIRKERNILKLQTSTLLK
jgi:hypothetical protein